MHTQRAQFLVATRYALTWIIPEVSNLGIDEKGHGLWERDCGCHCSVDVAVRMHKVLTTPYTELCRVTHFTSN